MIGVLFIALAVLAGIAFLIYILVRPIYRKRKVKSEEQKAIAQAEAERLEAEQAKIREEEQKVKNLENACLAFDALEGGADYRKISSLTDIWEKYSITEREAIISLLNHVIPDSLEFENRPCRVIRTQKYYLELLEREERQKEEGAEAQVKEELNEWEIEPKDLDDDIEDNEEADANYEDDSYYEEKSEELIAFENSLIRLGCPLEEVVGKVSLMDEMQMIGLNTKDEIIGYVHRKSQGYGKNKKYDFNTDDLILYGSCEFDYVVEWKIVKDKSEYIDAIYDEYCVNLCRFLYLGPGEHAPSQLSPFYTANYLALIKGCARTVEDALNKYYGKKVFKFGAAYNDSLKLVKEHLGPLYIDPQMK